MPQQFVMPRYADRALSQVMPSVAARLAGLTPPIELPQARRYVVLLVDGLGYHQLIEHIAHADTMSQQLRAEERITCSVPSTTATSLTSLGTGAPPGEHGVVGYSFYEPSVDRVINALTWGDGPQDVAGFIQIPTVFRRLTAAGCATSAAVTLDRFAHSALTHIAFHGTQLYPVTHEGDQEEFAALVATALHSADVIYCYERMLDHDGHGYGVGSWQWLERLQRVDDLVLRLTQVLPEDTCLLVTGDHGMINVPPAARVIAEDEPRLASARLGGEPRLRHVYGDDPRALAWAWSLVLGERALVLRREEALEAGWFGPQVSALSAARLGDVIVAMHSDYAVMSRQSPGEFNLIGMHGSLTAAEMEVPLLTFGGQP